MSRVRTRVFKNNRSQAVRLPKPVAFPDSVREVEVIADNDRRIIVPVGHAWDDWFDGPGVSADFMNQRLQPEDQTREPF